MTWQEIKIKKPLPSVPSYVQLRVTSKCPGNNCGYPFWAIDHVEICSENGKRIDLLPNIPILLVLNLVSELRGLTISQEANKASCQVIKYENQQIYQTPVDNARIRGRPFFLP